MAFDKNHMSTGMKAVVVIFAVILVFTLMLPSLSALVSKKDQEQQADQPKQEQTEGPKSAEDVNNIYQPAVDSLERRLQQNPDNVAILNDLARAYFDWGVRLSFFATDEATLQKRSEVFVKSVEAYDKLLAISPSNTTVVDRSLALYYSGDVTGAINALEEFTQKTTDFAPAWANLGMYYQTLGMNDKAKEAYQKAADLDADGSLGIKSYAEQRINEIDNPPSATAQPEGASVETEAEPAK